MPSKTTKPKTDAAAERQRRSLQAVVRAMRSAQKKMDAYWKEAQAAEAVAVDAAIRNGVKDRTNGKPLATSQWFVHRSLKPLAEVDLSGMFVRLCDDCLEEANLS